VNTTYSGETGQFTGTAGFHPVTVSYAPLGSRNKLYAVPIVGIVLKEIMLIPFFIALYLVGILVSLTNLVAWIPVLFVGTYPDFANTINGGYVRWMSRVATFMTGIHDRYPSFSFSDDASLGGVSITWPLNANPNRLWAIPLVGIMLKSIICIPHFIVLWVLSVICGLVLLVSWIPVLTTGFYPDWAFVIVGGTIRWQARLLTYMYGVHDQYPPFSLS
jgi:Domain of unknown function (DUF4389)